MFSIWDLLELECAIDSTTNQTPWNLAARILAGPKKMELNDTGSATCCELDS